MRVAELKSRKDQVESPALAPLPKERRRLLDHGLLHYEASTAGFSERYRRGETSHTVHVWWARRPHSAMRSLVFASLCPDVSETTLRLMNELSTPNRVPEPVIAQARGILSEAYARPPRLLDMFGGGGTIAFEAATLGAEAYSIDSNQLAVFVQKCNLEYPTNLDSLSLIGLVRDAGRRVLRRLTEETSPLFPHRGETFGYYWTYSHTCQACDRPFFLSKRPWLSKKNGKRTVVHGLRGNSTRQTIRIGEAHEGWSFKSAWTGRNGTALCPHCGAANAGINVKRCRDELVATVRLAEPRGKVFEAATPQAVPPKILIDKIEKRVLKQLGQSMPDSRLPKWSGIVNPALYGIDSHADFLNPRQRTVLLLLIKCLKEEHKLLTKALNPNVARCVTAFLAGMIDQLVDWNCRLSMWIPENEQVGRAFCGPGVAMLWDYMETDPLLGGPANLWKKLDRIVVGVAAVTTNSNRVHVRHGYAQDLPFANETFDAIVTDPPYYDNVYYNALADFFYAWKRLLLKDLEPALFSELTTDESRELVASKFRSGSGEAAHERYCRDLSQVLQEAERVLTWNGLFAFLFSHNSLRGWEALIRAYRATSLRITSVQPLSIERKQRPRAMTSDAVNTCVVFVAHKTTGTRRKSTLQALSNELCAVGKDFVSALRGAGWSEEDIGVAYYAQGVGMLANVDLSPGEDTEALKSLLNVTQEAVPSFTLAGRWSL